MGFLDKFFGGGSKSEEGKPTAKKTDKASKRRIDIDVRFERLRTSVSGTMSAFYVAKDRELNRTVGLKLCDLEKHRFFESRFKGMKKPSEGSIASSMHHPNIVETLEYGLTNKDEPYLVMEFVEGPGLQLLIHNRETEMLAGKRLSLIKQMADALYYVHKQGFIHRDICPRNFICSPDINHIKLIDFGLTVPATPAFMQPGNRTGTPLYMAPEVVRRRPTDQKVDIFSFGVTCYQLLTFELPWPGGETSGLAALNHDTSAARDILEYRPDLNKSLAGLLMQSVKANPAERVQSMEAFLKILNGVKSETQ
ncbi:MAG: serine/threonine-protein kinase [Pirellulaceae bacterium]|nr:serine/threonine-protein kinase [Pirellulaceae bacterium]